MCCTVRLGFPLDCHHGIPSRQSQCWFPGADLGDHNPPDTNSLQPHDAGKHYGGGFPLWISNVTAICVLGREGKQLGDAFHRKHPPGKEISSGNTGWLLAWFTKLKGSVWLTTLKWDVCVLSERFAERFGWRRQFCEIYRLQFVVGIKSCEFCYIWPYKHKQHCRKINASCSANLDYLF